MDRVTRHVGPNVATWRLRGQPDAFDVDATDGRECSDLETAGATGLRHPRLQRRRGNVATWRLRGQPDLAQPGDLVFGECSDLETAGATGP